MTKTKASSADTVALQAVVCGCVYCWRRGWFGSSRNGRAISARSSTSIGSKPAWVRASSSNQRATGRPTRPGRVLASHDAQARHPAERSCGADPPLTYERMFARTYVPVIACILIDGFELRAALLGKPRLMLAPAALAPALGEEPILGPVTAVAEAAGVRPGMRMGEALATCPRLVLVDRDPARAEQEWEALLRRLEDVGLSVEASERGTVYFDTRGVERLYGGPDRVLAKALKAVGPEWDPRAGGAARRVAGLAAGSVARPRAAVVVNQASPAPGLPPPPPPGPFPPP